MRSHSRGLMSASIIAPPPDRLISSTSMLLRLEADGRGFAREAVAIVVAVVGAARRVARNADRGEAVALGLAAALGRDQRVDGACRLPPRIAERNLFIERTSHAMTRRS